jgi:transcriptional regulator with XRE-family HTH domain
VPIDPEQLTRQIGRRVAELRIGRGLTQEAFSVVLRSTVQWVSQVEAGRNLTIHTLAKIANALDVTVAELLVEAKPDSRAVRRGRPRKQP